MTNFGWNVNTVGSLPWAINKANTDAGPDDIIFDLNPVVAGPGPNNLPLQVIEPTSTLNVTESVRIIGPEANPQGDHIANPLNSVVQISGKRPFWFSHSKAGAQASEVSGLNSVNCTNLGATASMPPSADVYGGGAIVVERGKLTLNGNKFKDNQAPVFSTAPGTLSGGGAVLVGMAATLDLEIGFDRKTEDPELAGEANLFKNNQCGYGGAIANYGMLNVRGGDFKDNMAAQPGGGAGLGGAIYSRGPIHTLASSQTTMFKDNKATQRGGAIYVESPQVPSGWPVPTVACDFDKFTFLGNESMVSGGAIQLHGVDLTLTNSSVLQNTSGAITLATGPNGQRSKVTATEVDFDGNLGPVNPNSNMPNAVFVGADCLLVTSKCHFNNNSGVNVSRVFLAPPPGATGWYDDPLMGNQSDGVPNGN